MSKEKYILKNQVHFGSLKTSVPKGAIIIVDKENNNVEINGASHDNVNEIEMCIKAGFIIPYVEGETKVDSEVKVYPKAKNKKTYTVEKSDVDSMDKELKVDKKAVKKESKKASKLEVIREVESDGERGLKVIASDAKVNEVTDKQIMEVINADDGEIVAKIPKKANRPKGVPENTAPVMSDSDKEALDAINGEQGKVVKRIGKSSNTKEVSSGKKLTAKRGVASPEAEAKAKANAEARKKASEARRAKAKEKK